MSTRPLLETAHGALPLPAFLPDATRAGVRCVEAEGVAQAGVRALMVNAYHVQTRPGVRVVQRLGGLHRFMGWDGPIATDSGGFQVLSLVRSDAKRGVVRPKGVLLRDPETGKRTWLTPENTVRSQLDLGTDVVIALDDCTSPEMPVEEQRLSVERTERWFRAARSTFEQAVDVRVALDKRPLLVGVVQGGRDLELRRRCAESILETGADAVGFGGWPVDAEGKLLVEAFDVLLELVPRAVPIFALGVGKPEHLVALCARRPGFVFDCTLPTRDARSHRLYAFEPGWPAAALPCDDSFYGHVYILDDKHARAEEPVEAGCDCACCTRYGRAYLHHMFKVKDPQAERLASIHNLRFYTRLVERLAP